MGKTANLKAFARLQLVQKVDKLGKLLADIADLELKAENIKDWLKDKHGDGNYEGRLFRATVSTYDQDRLNMDAVRAKLSPQFIRANTETKEITKVVVKSKNAVNVSNRKVA